MLNSHFLFGLVVGVALYWGYQKFAKGGMAKKSSGQ